MRSSTSVVECSRRVESANTRGPPRLAAREGRRGRACRSTTDARASNARYVQARTRLPRHRRCPDPLRALGAAGTSRWRRFWHAGSNTSERRNEAWRSADSAPGHSKRAPRECSRWLPHGDRQQCRELVPHSAEPGSLRRRERSNTGRARPAPRPVALGMFHMERRALLANAAKRSPRGTARSGRSPSPPARTPQAQDHRDVRRAARPNRSSWGCSTWNGKAEVKGLTKSNMEGLGLLGTQRSDLLVETARSAKGPLCACANASSTVKRDVRHGVDQSRWVLFPWNASASSEPSGAISSWKQRGVLEVHSAPRERLKHGPITTWHDRSDRTGDVPRGTASSSLREAAGSPLVLAPTPPGECCEAEYAEGAPRRSESEDSSRLAPPASPEAPHTSTSPRRLRRRVVEPQEKQKPTRGPACSRSPVRRQREVPAAPKARRGSGQRLCLGRQVRACTYLALLARAPMVLRQARPRLPSRAASRGGPRVLALSTCLDHSTTPRTLRVDFAPNSLPLPHALPQRTSRVRALRPPRPLREAPHVEPAPDGLARLDHSAKLHMWNLLPTALPPPPSAPRRATPRRSLTPAVPRGTQSSRPRLPSPSGGPSTWDEHGTHQERREENGAGPPSKMWTGRKRESWAALLRAKVRSSWGWRERRTVARVQPSRAMASAERRV